MYRTRCSQRGMTLIEVLTVVGIMGVIALVTVPALFQLMPQYRIRSAASEMAAGFRLVRQKAMTTRTPWKIQFDSSGERYSYAFFNGNAVTNSTLQTAANWTNMTREGKTASSIVWNRLSAVDLRTNTSNPFNAVNCGDSYPDVIFLRDGTVSNAPACGSATVLSFTTSPSIKVSVDNNFVRYNRYYLAVAQNGVLTITPAKE